MLYRRGNRWWIEIERGGKRIRRATHTSDQAEAQRKHDELKARLSETRPENVTRDLAGAFVLWLKAKPRSRNQKNAIALIRKTYRNRLVIEITPGSIEEAFENKSPGTYNNLVNIIRASLNLASRKWGTPVLRLPRRTEPEGRITFLTLEEWTRLRLTLPPHLRAMAEFAIATGLRWSNVALLEWSQISIAQKLAWIHPDQAKAGKPIGVPLSDEALAVLRSQSGKHRRYVFVYKGNPIGSPKSAWRKACKRVGLDSLRWHDLRHTWASWHAMNGTPLEVLQKLGGWKSREMVERYAHFAQGFTAQYANNARPISLRNTQEKT